MVDDSTCRPIRCPRDGQWAESSNSLNHSNLIIQIYTLPSRQESYRSGVSERRAFRANQKEQEGAQFFNSCFEEDDYVKLGILVCRNEKQW